MNNPSVIRKIDHLGRIVIPKDFRRANGIQNGDPLEIIYNENNEIVIRKHDPHKELSTHLKYLYTQIDLYKFDLSKNKRILDLLQKMIDTLEED